MIIRAREVSASIGRATAPWITVGQEYVALELHISPAEVAVRVITNEGGRDQGLFDLRDFDVVDGRLSALWTASTWEGQLTIGPGTWTRNDFWDDMDGDTPEPKPLAEMAERARAATRAFDQAVAEMHAEAGRPWQNTPGAASDIQRR